MGFYQQEAPSPSMGPKEQQEPHHCVSPMEGLSAFSRACLKDLRSMVLGLMEQGTKALKEDRF